MNDSIKQNWFKLGLLFVLIFVIISGFYWFKWKPNQIKQKCFAEAEFDRRAILEFDDTKRQELINTYYQDCLMKFGLK
jgi:hypothetical protein